MKDVGMRRRLPSPALAIATGALFVALGGGAVAAGIVPLAKHARTADSATVARNAKHLGGKTAAELAASMRGPQGLPGATGAVGPAGPTGEAGPKGATGAAGAAGAEGPEGPQGLQGEEGDVGTGLKIVGTVATVGDLPLSGTTGDAYLIAGELYVWTGAAWTNAGHVQGVPGVKGDKGDTGDAGSQGPQGLAGTAAVSIHTQAYALAPADIQLLTVSCGAGQKAVNGGFDSDTGFVFSLDMKPTASDDGWQIVLMNNDPSAATGTLYGICLG